MPSGTDFVGGVSVETADIRAHEGKSEQVVRENTVYGESHVLNSRPVVSHPVVSVFAYTWEVGASEDVGSEISLVDEVLGGCLGLHKREEVVDIILPSVDGIVPSVYPNRLVLEVSPSWHVERLVSVGVYRSLFRLAVAIAEVCCFILV